MDAEEFRKFGKAAVDYLANYFENIRERSVLPFVEPGYLQNLLPKEAPKNPEKWEDILEDMERVIMPGVSFEVFCSLTLRVSLSSLFRRRPFMLLFFF